MKKNNQKLTALVLCALSAVGVSAAENSPVEEVAGFDGKYYYDPAETPAGFYYLVGGWNQTRALRYDSSDGGQLLVDNLDSKNTSYIFYVTGQDKSGTEKAGILLKDLGSGKRMYFYVGNPSDNISIGEAGNDNGQIWPAYGEGSGYAYGWAEVGTAGGTQDADHQGSHYLEPNENNSGKTFRFSKNDGGEAFYRCVGPHDRTDDSQQPLWSFNDRGDWCRWKLLPVADAQIETLLGSDAFTAYKTYLSQNTATVEPEPEPAPLTLQTVTLPSFSRSHGLCLSTVRVSITPGNPEAEVHYTLDGSEPTKDSPLYKGTLVLDKTTVLRAVEIADGTISRPATATYIFSQSVFDQGNTPEGYPTVWGPFCQIGGTAPAYYEMYKGFDNYNDMLPHMEQGLKDLPILSVVTDRDNIFGLERDEQKGGIYIYTGTPVGDPVGRGWERPVSMELIGGPQKHDLTYDCGIVLHGGHGRLPEKNPKHSFRLKFKKEYSGKKTLHYPVFASDPNRGYTEEEKYDQLVLRCHFGNSWQHWNNGYRNRAQYTRDLWARQTQRLMGWTAVDGLYVNLFINGLYWGLYNVAERVDDQFCKDHEGGSKSSYDVYKVEDTQDELTEEELKAKSQMSQAGGDYVAASEGSIGTWDEMVATSEYAGQDDGYLRMQGLNADGQRDPEQEPLLNIDSFIDYMLINQYSGNNDWQTHNWYAFCKHGADSKGIQFVCWDSEQIFEGNTDANPLDWNQKGFPTGIFQNLMKHPDFRHRYMDRAYSHLSANGQLSQQKVVELWDSLYHVIENAVYLESSRWGDYRHDIHPWQGRGDLFTVDNHFMNERNRLLNDYFPKRSGWLMQQLVQRGWMSETPVPVFALNSQQIIKSDTLTVSDILTLTAAEDIDIVCTTDSMRPVTWVGSRDGLLTSTAFDYATGDNLLNHLKDSDFNTRVTFCAIGHDRSDWSPMVSRRFFIKLLEGDANCDGIVDNADVAAIADYLVGKTGERFSAKAADVNNDDKVDVSDIAALVRLLTGGNH